MPTIIDPQTGAEREIPQREYDALIERVANDQQGSAYQWSSDRPQGVRLWDVIDNTWTRPFPAGLATSYYLRKVVFRCSACIFTTPYANLVEPHIRGVRQSAAEHNGAEVTPTLPMPGVEPGQQCSGCGAVFTARKGQGHKHLQAALNAAPKHDGAKELLLRRFALGQPTVPLVVSETSQEPVVHSGERREGKRRRHRNRSRSKGAA